MNEETKQTLKNLNARVDKEFNDFVKRLDAVADAVALDELDYKKLYNGAFDMRSTVALIVKSLLAEEIQEFNDNVS